MTEISHKQVQAYLQAAADESLRVEEKALLDAHLVNCDNCRAYAHELNQLEAVLRTALHHRWDSVLFCLPMNQILGQTTVSPLRRALSVAATPILVSFLVLLAITLTRGTISSGSDPATPSATIIATTVPTPSADLIHTNTVNAASPSSTDRIVTTTKACESMIYTIQPGDTLASIAEKFGVSMQSIREVNRITADVITDTIIIPVCNPTPSNTLTYTPASYTP